MKNKLIYTTLITVALLMSCGGSNSSNESLDALVSTRDSLKKELTKINQKIAALDTTKVDLLPLVTASAVVQKDFVHMVEVQGAVETDQNVLLNAEANGTIKTIHVKEGQKVSKGQALITIDSEILASTINEVETSLEMANYMLDKQQKLLDEGVGVEIEYEQAKNQKKALENKLKTMRSQRGKTIVRAPFAGVIDNIMANQGEMASPQYPLLRLVNNKNVYITASLSENLLSNVHLGTNVDLVFPSMNDTVIYAKVTFKGNFIDPVNRTFNIQITLKNNTLLLPNQLAKVSVIDYSKKDALVINSESIIQDTQNNNYVYKMKKGEGDTFTLTKVYVRIDKSYMGEACITPLKDGKINVGDQLVLAGAKGVTESDIVKIIG